MMYQKGFCNNETLKSFLLVMEGFAKVNSKTKTDEAKANQQRRVAHAP